MTPAPAVPREIRIGMPAAAVPACARAVHQRAARDARANLRQTAALITTPRSISRALPTAALGALALAGCGSSNGSQQAPAAGATQTATPAADVAPAKKASRKSGRAAHKPKAAGQSTSTTAKPPGPTASAPASPSANPAPAQSTSHKPTTTHKRKLPPKTTPPAHTTPTTEIPTTTTNTTPTEPGYY